MNASLRRRLRALETPSDDDAPRLVLLLRSDRPEADVQGIRSAGPSLPQDVPRLPRESLDDLKARAAGLMLDRGPRVLVADYSEQVAQFMS